MRFSHLIALGLLAACNVAETKDSDSAAHSDLEGSVASTSSELGTLSIYPERTFVTDGTVYALGRRGDTVYVGGQFRYIGQRTGPFAVLDAASGALDKTFPEFATGFVPFYDPSALAGVDVVISDGAGGYFVGGNFSHAGSQRARGLARVRADKTIDFGFSATIVGDDYNDNVAALALVGSTLFVGGDFESINGVARVGLAALDAATGAVLPIRADASRVSALTAVGNTLYVGGAFTTLGGSPRSSLGAIDVTTGAVTSFVANVTGSVSALNPRGDDLYVGGSFSDIGGSARSNFARVSPIGSVDPGTPAVDGAVHALLADGSTLYLGGEFQSIAGLPRSRVGAVNVESATVLPFAPSANGAVLALGLHGTTLYAGGAFTTVNQQARRYFTTLDSASGNVGPWGAHASHPVRAIVATASSVFVGGRFRSLTGQLRSNLAAMNDVTRRPTAWKPSVDAAVNDLRVLDDAVVVGGAFTRAGTSNRGGLAAFDATSGALLPFAPSTTPPITKLEARGGSVYFAKYVPGQGASHVLGASDLASGAVRWQTTTNAAVSALVASDSTLYLGGLFTLVGATRRVGLAAIDTATGTLLPFARSVSGGNVTSFALVGSALHMSGYFSSVGGSPRNHFAAVNASTSSLLPWQPSYDPVPYVMLHEAGKLYVGSANQRYAETTGAFATLDPLSNSVDLRSPLFSGTTTSGQIRAMVATSRGLWLGGDFPHVWLKNGLPIDAGSLARFDATPE